MNWKFWKKVGLAKAQMKSNLGDGMNRPGRAELPLSQAAQQRRPTIPEPKLIEAFHGAQESDLFRAVIQVLDAHYEQCCDRAQTRDGRYTERELNRDLGGAEACSRVAATLADYAALARQKEAGEPEPTLTGLTG